jgi:hypothetical protein
LVKLEISIPAKSSISTILYCMFPISFFEIKGKEPTDLQLQGKEKGNEYMEYYKKARMGLSTYWELFFNIIICSLRKWKGNR